MLSIHEVNRYMDNKKRENYATFELIYEKCKKMILKYAENEKYRFFFEVPEFILGLPVYKLNDAIEYIVEKLQKSGFLVKYYFPKYVYISWSFDEINGKTPQINHMMHMNKQINQLMERQHVQQSTMVPKLSSFQDKRIMPPLPISTRTASHSIVMPDVPAMQLPLPSSTHSHNPSSSAATNFIKSIADYKSSGKFSLNIT